MICYDNNDKIIKLKKRNKVYLAGIFLLVLIIIIVSLFYIYKKKIIYVKKYCNTCVLNNNIKIYNEISNSLDENYHNSMYKLILKSAYGDIQAYHPKVLNFEKEWNGYKYWMTFSPFPYGDEKYENPHILVSNDLILWVEPNGFKNPVEDTPEDFIAKKNYNSDPHIVYNSDTDTMELYWRYVNDQNDYVIIYRKTTKDGVHWTDKEEILKATRTEKDYISPAIIYEDGIYKMWFVDRDRSLKYMESNDGYHYSKEKIINLTYPLTKLTTWHIDVIKTEIGYEMLVVAYVYWEDRNSMNLYYFSSEDNENWSDGVTILRPSISSWDNRGIYRSSFIYENGKYYVFYSGIGLDYQRGIGLSYGDDITNLIGGSKNDFLVY